MKIKLKINDNIKTLNPKKTLLEMLTELSLKERRELLINKTKYNLITYIKKIFNKKCCVITYGEDGKLITYSNSIEYSYYDLKEASKTLDIESYKLIKNLKKQLHKDIKENLPRILSDISKNLNLYRWKVDILSSLKLKENPTLQGGDEFQPRL